MTLSGMGNMDQLVDNIATMGEFVPLNEDELAVIEKATDVIKNAVEIPCTSCGYCIEAGCPVNINIPKYFTLYNAEKAYNKTDVNNKEQYESLCESFGKASDCIACGKCETACPQHLKVRDLLVKVKEQFEK